jgi:hypothetical protein
MNTERIVLRTDRNRQWGLLEERFKRNGATRKNIRNCHALFFENKVNGKFDWLDRFVLYPDPSFKGWQRLLDEEFEEVITDQNFRTLNNMFCGQIADYYFCIEDQDYYFKTTFGDVYDKDRKFALRINREPNHRDIVLTENKIFAELLRRFSFWLKNQDGKEEGLLRFNEGYFESLLPIVDRMPFMDRKYAPKDRTEDGSAAPAQIQASVKSIFRCSLNNADGSVDKERIEASRRVTDLLMSHADGLADIRILYDQAKGSFASNG